MNANNQNTLVTSDHSLSLLEAAQGLPGPKDGTGIGDLATTAVVDGWTHDFLSGEGDPADSRGLASAFRFGVKADGRCAGRSFLESESELRSEWSSEKGRAPWETVRNAVWAGFDRARDRRG